MNSAGATGAVRPPVLLRAIRTVRGGAAERERGRAAVLAERTGMRWWGNRPMPPAAFPANARRRDWICATRRTRLQLRHPMKITRRDWLKLTGTAALATQLPRSLHAAAGGDTEH